MKAPIYAALVILACANAAHADSCDKSRDYILASGDLPQKPEAYRDLSKMCRETLLLSNVKDAFLLKAGAVAVVPRTDSVSATASTLSQFCSRFPKGTLHFVSRSERRQAADTARAVRIGVGNTTPCKKITRG